MGLETMQQYLTSVFGDNKLAMYGALAVLALIILLVLWWGFRALFSGRVRAGGGRNRQPRLGVVDAYDLDRQRQLIIVRRDGVEHLVMIGGNQDMVIESNIESGLSGNSTFATRAPAEETVAMRPPKPAVFGSRRPILRSVERSMTSDGRGEDDAG